MKNLNNISEIKLRQDITDAFDLLEFESLFYRLSLIDEFRELEKYAPNHKNRVSRAEYLIKFVKRHDQSLIKLLLILRDERPNREMAEWNKLDLDDVVPPSNLQLLDKFRKSKPTDNVKIYNLFAGINQTNINRETLRWEIANEFKFEELKILLAKLIQIDGYEELENFIIENCKTTTQIILYLIEFIERRDESLGLLFAILSHLKPEVGNVEWTKFDPNHLLRPITQNLETFKNLQPIFSEELNLFFSGIID